MTDFASEVARLRAYPPAEPAASPAAPVAGWPTVTQELLMGLAAVAAENLLDHVPDNDGLADCAPGAAQAEAALPETGGAIIVPRGVYAFATPWRITRSNVALLFEGGAGAARFVKRAGWSGGADAGLLEVAGARNFALRGGALDGAGRPGHGLVLIDVDGAVVELAEAVNHPGVGWIFDGARDASLNELRATQCLGGAAETRASSRACRRLAIRGLSATGCGLALRLAAAPAAGRRVEDLTVDALRATSPAPGAGAQLQLDEGLRVALRDVCVDAGAEAAAPLRLGDAAALDDLDQVRIEGGALLGAAAPAAVIAAGANIGDVRVHGADRTAGAQLADMTGAGAGARLTFRDMPADIEDDVVDPVGCVILETRRGPVASAALAMQVGLTRLHAGDFGLVAASPSSAAANKAALDKVIARIRSTGGELQLPGGDLFIEALGPLLVEVNNPTPFMTLRIAGQGMSETALRCPTPRTGAALSGTPARTGRLGTLELENFTLDCRTDAGASTPGGGIDMSWQTAALIRRVQVLGAQGVAFDFREVWDWRLDTLKALYGGAPGIAAYRFDNAIAAFGTPGDPADDLAVQNSSTNNGTADDLHAEGNQGPSLHILRSTRKMSFRRFKGHFDPGAFPGLGTEHVLIDGMNVQGDAADLDFEDINLAAGDGSGLIVRNTGGPADEGPRLRMRGGSITAQPHFGVRIEASSGSVVRDIDMARNTHNLFVAERARAVLDVASMRLEDQVNVWYGGPNHRTTGFHWTDYPAGTDYAYNAFEIHDDGGLMRATPSGPELRLVPPGRPGFPAAAQLQWLEPGFEGQVVAIRTLQSGSNPYTINVENLVAGGNIRTAGAVTRQVIGERSALFLQYARRIGAWLEIDLTT
ncbi:MAG: hypothetical protein AAF192_01085 [Pseudomonadota bacterium]